MIIDARTLIFATFLVNTVGAVLFIGLYGGRYPFGGPHLWSLGIGLGALSQFLFVLRGLVHDALSVVVADILLVVGFGLIWMGTARFRGGMPGGRAVVGVAGLTAALVTWFTTAAPSVAARIVVVSVVVASLSLATAREFVLPGKGPRGKTRTTAAVLFGLNGVTMLFRAAGELGGAPTLDLLASPRTVATYVWLLVFSVGGLVAILLLMAERLRHELDSLVEAIPMCASCRRLQEEPGSWKRLEHYLLRHKRLRLTHGVCPECAEELYGGSLGPSRGWPER